MFDLSFYKGKSVLVTGHTGFKGSWLCKLLINAGADVTGYALQQPAGLSLYDITGMNGFVRSYIGDIRDIDNLLRVFKDSAPEFVFHLAAQPIVRESYKNPVVTYETNVMGTVNVLECVRNTESVRSVVNVTTDKVYRNNEWEWGYRENEILDGYDPYSNSKSCSELVTACYNRSFLNDKGISVSTMRAGNVIGGGDFSADRILPDCYRAVTGSHKMLVRNPYSIRPYQHVLEPLIAYLLVAAKQYSDNSFAGQYNVGPDYLDCICTGRLVDLFIKYWGNDLERVDANKSSDYHEADCLKLDCSRIRKTFGWSPRWHIDKAVEKVVEWNKCYLHGEDILNCMDSQISEYLEASDE